MCGHRPRLGWMDGRELPLGKAPQGLDPPGSAACLAGNPCFLGQDAGFWVGGAELCPAFCFGPKNPGAGEASAGLVHTGRTRLEERELVGVGIALFGAGEPNQAARLRHRAARAHGGDQLGPWRRREAALSPEVGI